MIIVDTNVWSETVRSKPDPAVVRWVLAHASEIAITSITIGELRYGVATMPSGKRRDALAAQIDRLIDGSDGRTFAYDSAAARELARIKIARKKLGLEVTAPEDAMIAAIAAVHDCAVATRNVEDFNGMGVDIIDPWTD